MVSVLQNEKVLEIGCTAMWIQLTLLKDGKHDKFYVMLFFTIFKKWMWLY